MTSSSFFVEMEGTTPPIASATGTVKGKKHRDVSPGIAQRIKKYESTARKPKAYSLVTPTSELPVPSLSEAKSILSGAEKSGSKSSRTMEISSSAMREKVDTAVIENASKLRSASTPKTFTKIRKFSRKNYE